MSTATIHLVSAKYGKGLNATLWTLQILVALAFFAAGAAKLAGAPMMVVEFNQIGVGQWFRYVTAIFEITGATLLLVPRQAFRGGALLVMVMSGALVAHLTILGLATAPPAAVLLLLSGTIAWMRRPLA